jgi:AmmeMemoRadiSam system protein A
MTLTAQERQILLELARQTIARVARGEAPPPVALSRLPEALVRPGASFVTLTVDDELRGCIGTLEAHRPLAQDVQENAIGAAFRDPRFPPVSADEVDDLHIEVSVLTTPQPLAYSDGNDLLSKLRPLIDGVVIEQGWHRATFLPQVWEKLPDPREFMAHLCLKAGLPPDAYRRGGLEVLTYQVEKFEEEPS